MSGGDAVKAPHRAGTSVIAVRFSTRLRSQRRSLREESLPYRLASATANSNIQVKEENVTSQAIRA